MASEQFIKDVASKINEADLAKIAAHMLLRQASGFNREMAYDKGNDAEQRANSMMCLIDADALISFTQDSFYNELNDEFFNNVSEHMVALAPKYVKAD
jgi:hypothetical protein